MLFFVLNPLFPTNDKPQIFPYDFTTESNIKDTRKKEMITRLAMLNFLFQWLHQSLQVQKKTNVLHVWLTFARAYLEILAPGYKLMERKEKTKQKQAIVAWGA